jgi:hypothetical protein
MAIPKGTKKNFETLQLAMAAGHVCVMEVLDGKTGEVVDAICMINKVDDMYQMAPIAFMPRENPYDRFSPPDPNNPEMFATGEKH